MLTRVLAAEQHPPDFHAVRNVGTGTGTALATDVVEKGKPLLTVAQ